MDIKKSSVSITLAILSPALLTGCGSSDDGDDPNRTSSGNSGYRGGSGYYGGGSRAVSPSSPRGGFGGFGRFFSGGS